ncbi:NHLP bacteriocin export ABC transporter permease/ATPase subunit [Legionella fallonii]|uniref:Putative Xenobiotic-transporting ATPase n=1 Tax=Legionella fallonii LLAP-10 TaxID=1212491 RepID=A0A098G272_9GAMM|nr:NHLP bacteriocin export ABC transporter permease/ATPase subunit [Legionella fallonii]CEG56064.1 putative Xenobiotic-transporting ATPase [Legionella fallonii LLAP-10]
MSTQHESPIPSSNEFNLLEMPEHFEISSGSIDVFMVRTRGNARGRRFLLGHWNAGELIIGLKEITTKNIQLIASCSYHAKLTPLTWDNVTAPQQREALAQWEEHFLSFLRANKIHYAKELLLDKSAQEHQLHHEILKFYQKINPLLLKAIQLIQKKELQNRQQRKKNENNLLQRAYKHMLSVLQPGSSDVLLEKKDTLQFCVQTAAQFYHLSLQDNIVIKQIEEISQNTGMQVRQVELKDTWWLGTTNPLLLRKDGENHFYLALPKFGRGLTLYDPHRGIKKKLSRKEAQLFSPIAWLLYCPLPQKALTVKDLIVFAFKGCQGDLWRLLFIGSMAAVLSLAVPWFTGVLFEQVVPSGTIAQLKQITWALLIAACSASLFELVRAITILRIGSRLNLNLELAIWDRLIRLPASFFRQFSTGDLIQRAMSTSSVRHIMAGVVINTLLSGVFSVCSLILLFYYDAMLALTAMAVLAVISIYTVFISFKQFSLYELVVSLSSELSGLVIQLLAGIGKIQTSGREKTAFSLWGIKNSQIKKEHFKTHWYNALLSSLNALAMPLLSLIIFAQFLNRDTQLGVGIFIAFNAALGQLTAGVLGLTNTMSTVINSIPIIKRTMPILENLPEIHTGKKDPGILAGKLEAELLSFSYSPKEQAIIQDVSFIIEPGQYVAITGPSGSGKSTLIRLLLGFEKPNHGTILFDDHDMKQLNIQRVREQCGVVLQGSFLMPGTLFENIVGFSSLTQEDAWYAAEMAGLADDVRKMPMGMHTIISERGGSLSGGQRQRVLIARALAKKPKILLFDEATSALDNITQSIVIHSLEQLKITRIIIAHRLSTIEKADSIIVMQQGKIIQQGTYKKLMQEEGLFQSMAKRQLLETHCP